MTEELHLRGKTMDRLQKDGLIDFGVAVADLLELNPSLHAILQPFLATAIQRNLSADKLIDLLLEHIQHDSAHPLYLWLMELRIKLGLSTRMKPLQVDPDPSIEVVATVSLVSDAASRIYASDSPRYRASQPTIPAPDEVEDCVPASERDTLIPAAPDSDDHR